jgi:hypothetical protein
MQLFRCHPSGDRPSSRAQLGQVTEFCRRHGTLTASLVHKLTQGRCIERIQSRIQARSRLPPFLNCRNSREADMLATSSRLPNESLTPVRVQRICRALE